MARGGSMLSGIAVGRILIRVGVPEKADYEGSLNAIHKSLVAFREMVDADSRQSIQNNIATTEESLKQLNDVTAAQTVKGNNFELAQQKRFAKESAEAFGKATDKASEIAKRAMTVGKGPTMRKIFKVDTDISKALKEDVAGLGTQYKRLKKFAENYYKMDAEQRIRMKINLQNQLELMVKVDRQMVEDIRRAEAQDVATEKDIARKNAMLDVMYLEQDANRNNMQAVKDLQTWQKRADEATLRGAKNRKEAIKEATVELKEWVGKLKEASDAAHEWADEKMANLNRRIDAFTGILMESTVVLTAFYYKLNEVVDSIMRFQQELQNAQSIYQTSYETLFQLSDEVVRFGTQFGVSYDNAAKGLYQFASAGLSASDSLMVLNETLKLSMAVQGDHNTLSKLTTQIIYGFGLQMTDAADVTDKLAHSINKSLIEWQDLASSVKFALPFFVSSGQSLEQLLGALEILTNRALEAGIAGRGLRQALAEFTQHAKDNEAAFHKLGVEILNTDGNMRDLTDIALQFNRAIGENATDMDLMIALMEDLNIRGATAFIHLARNADEYTAAVQDLENATGAAHKMAMIQQMGLEASLQRLKNRFQAAFLFSEEITTAAGQMNTLTLAVSYLMDQLSDLIIVGEGAKAQLTELGKWLKEVVIGGVIAFGKAVKSLIVIIREWSEAGLVNISMITLYFIPIMAVLKVVDMLSPSIGKVIISLYVLNKVIGISTIYWIMIKSVIIKTMLSSVLMQTVFAKMGLGMILTAKAIQSAFIAMWVAIAGSMVAFLVFYKVGMLLVEHLGPLVGALIAVAIAIALVNSAASGGLLAAPILKGWGMILAGGATLGVLTGAAAEYLMPSTGVMGALDTGEMAELEAYMIELEGRVNSNNALASGGATDLYVDNLYTANDDLGERAYSSGYTTTTNEKVVPKTTF